MAIVPAEGLHRLLITAYFSDGHTEDYTHQAVYTSNDREVASVDADGVVAPSVSEKLPSWCALRARLRVSELA